MFVRNVNKEISSIEESQIIFQLNTSLNHFKKKFELNPIHKCFVQKNSKFFVLDFDVVWCHVHIFVVCLTNIIKFRTIKKKSPTFFSRGVRKIRRGFTTLHIDDRTYPFGRLLQEKDSNFRPSGYEPDELPLLYPAIYFKLKNFWQKSPTNSFSLELLFVGQMFHKHSKNILLYQTNMKLFLGVLNLSTQFYKYKQV